MSSRPPRIHQSVAHESFLSLIGIDTIQYQTLYPRICYNYLPCIARSIPTHQFLADSVLCVYIGYSHKGTSSTLSIPWSWIDPESPTLTFVAHSGMIVNDNRTMQTYIYTVLHGNRKQQHAVYVSGPWRQTKSRRASKNSKWSTFPTKRTIKMRMTGRLPPKILITKNDTRQNKQGEKLCMGSIRSL